MKARTRRTATLLVGAALLGTGAAGCGDDDESSGGSGSAAGESQPETLAIELTGSGKELRMTAPKTVQAGLTSIRFTNSSREKHSLQLGRVDAGHEPSEVLQAGNAWASEGKPLPRWAYTEGGVPETDPGGTAQVTQTLAPGRYAAFETESEGRPAVAYFEVTGEAADGQLPRTSARIDMKEYSFEASGLSAGRQRVLVRNTGGEPHFVALAPLKAGKTIADVNEFLKKEKGTPPIDEAATVGTAVMDGGRSQVVDLELKAGSYALLCFVPDRKGGPPHAFKGMVSEATVR
jgi:hypothetical protein